jgi:hypothetical protein
MILCYFLEKSIIFSKHAANFLQHVDTLERILCFGDSDRDRDRDMDSFNVEELYKKYANQRKCTQDQYRNLFLNQLLNQDPNSKT